MRRSLRLPMAVLTLLSLLAAGAVVLALFQAPKTSNLVVHNGAGELALAQQVTLHFTSSSSTARETVTYQAPDRATLLVRNAGVTLEHRAIRDPSVPTQLFGPFLFLLKVNSFTSAPGGRFVATLPARDIVSASQAQTVHGSVRIIATVRGGVLIRLRELVDLRSTVGREQQTGFYCVSQVNHARVQGC